MSLKNRSLPTTVTVLPLAVVMTPGTSESTSPVIPGPGPSKGSTPELSLASALGKSWLAKLWMTIGGKAGGVGSSLAIGSSFWPYYWRRHERWPLPRDRRVEVPTAYASFPREILHPPRAWAERAYDLRRWTLMKSGGHFAALEEPEALARDIAEFFRPLR